MSLLLLFSQQAAVQQETGTAGLNNVPQFEERGLYDKEDDVIVYNELLDRLDI